MLSALPLLIALAHLSPHPEASADQVKLVRAPMEGETVLHDLPVGSEFIFNADMPGKAAIPISKVEADVAMLTFSTNGQPGVRAGTRVTLQPGAKLSADGDTNLLELSGGVSVSCRVEVRYVQRWETTDEAPPTRKPCPKDPYSTDAVPCLGELVKDPAPRKVQHEQLYENKHRCSLGQFLRAVGEMVAVNPADPAPVEPPAVDRAAAAKLDESLPLHDLPPGTRILFIGREPVSWGVGVEGDEFGTVIVDFETPKVAEKQREVTMIETGGLLTVRTGRPARRGSAAYRTSELTTNSDTVPRITCRREWLEMKTDRRDRDGWPQDYTTGSNPCTLKGFLKATRGRVLVLPSAR
jgi:hypothetical protein